MPGNLYKRGGVWWARAKVRGADRRCSLRTSSLPEARQRLKKFLEDSSHERFYGEARHTWKGAVADWNEQARGIGPSTVKRYLVSLAQVRPMLETLFLDEIDARTIAKIVTVRTKRGATNATIQRDLTAVSIVLRFAVRQGWLVTNAARAYDRGAVKERRDPIVLPEPEWIDAVVARARKTVRGGFHALIRFAQYTGARQESLAGLERGQLKAHGVELMTKRNRILVLELEARAKGTLEGTVPYLKEPYVFWHGKGKRFSSVSASFARVVKACVAAGEIPRRFRFHDLRHWYAVDYLRRGGTLERLKNKLGHDSVKTTEGYLKYLTAEEAERARAQSGAQ